MITGTEICWNSTRPCELVCRWDLDGRSTVKVLSFPDPDQAHAAQMILNERDPLTVIKNDLWTIVQMEAAL